MSIQRRLALSITLVLFISLLVGCGLTYEHAVRKVRTEMQAALAVGTDGAVGLLDDAPSTANPLTRLTAVVRDFDGDRHLQAELRALDGTVLAKSKLLRPENEAPGWFYQLVVSPIAPKQLSLPEAFRSIGRLTVAADAHNEVAEAWSDATLTLTIMAVFFAMVLALAFMTIRAALRPLQDICDAFLRIGAGDLAVRFAPNVSSELMPLRDGFNAMASRLADMDQQNRALHEQILTLLEEERAELARDLHDDVAPFVFAVGADAAMIRQYLAKDMVSEVGPRADAIADGVRHMQRHLKQVLRRLAPSALLDLGLSGAIDNLLEFWRKRKPQLVMSVSVEGEPLDPPLDAIAFRIVQEAISNAIRHGNPARIEVTVMVTDTAATVVVSDDGVGFESAQAKFGFGLTGMNERVRSVGGTLSVRARGSGRGVIVEASLPLRAERASRSLGLPNQMDAIA